MIIVASIMLTHHTIVRVEHDVVLYYICDPNARVDLALLFISNMSTTGSDTGTHGSLSYDDLITRLCQDAECRELSFDTQ